VDVNGEALSVWTFGSDPRSRRWVGRN
jgi:hypothetical protein